MSFICWYLDLQYVSDTCTIQAYSILNWALCITAKPGCGVDITVCNGMYRQGFKEAYSQGTALSSLRCATLNDYITPFNLANPYIFFSFLPTSEEKYLNQFRCE